MVFSLFGILSVVLEAVRPFLPLLVALLLVELALIAGAFIKHRKGPLDWKGARNLSGGIGIAVFIVLLALAPWITGASHSQLTGLLDYSALIAASLGAGVAAFLGCLPLLLCLHSVHTNDPA